MKLQNEMFTILAADADTATLRLHAGHTIYQAHFPGNPITPGVCIVQIIGELLSMRYQRPLALLRVVNLKFASPISPVDCPEVEVRFSAVSQAEGEVRAKGSIFAADEIKTKFSLVFRS